MDPKNAKNLLSGILNDDDRAVSDVISACFESEYRKRVGKETEVFLESIGNKSETSV